MDTLAVLVAQTEEQAKAIQKLIEPRILNVIYKRVVHKPKKKTKKGG